MWCKTADLFVDAINSVLIASDLTHRYTIDSIAEAAGIKPSSLVRILNRQYEPSLSVFERILTVCDFTITLK